MKNKGLTRRDLLKVTGAGGAIVALGSQPALAAPPKAEELPKVPRKRLGKTKKEIPILLMGGSMKFDPRFDPKFAECMRFGIDYFDVADCYAGGTAEPALGAYMEKAKNRDQVWITTKSDA
ncbi:MAG: aldo/keto reductase [Deltaproteobacteria bacterium]|nr:aldo/keto reductase [Deltaproteobacteria bacterium]